jgi:hypothetical protein
VSKTPVRARFSRERAPTVKPNPARLIASCRAGAALAAGTGAADRAPSRGATRAPGK